MEDKDQAQVWKSAGQIDELERRVDHISGRLDTHISACSVRFIILLMAVAAAATWIGVVISWKK